MFRTRNNFYLRVDKTTVLPLLLILHDPPSFTDVLFQELLQILQEILPEHLLKEKTNTTSSFSNEHLHFTYKFQHTPRYCVVTCNQEEETNNEKGKQKEDETMGEYDGGKYNAFTISKQTIIVETLSLSSHSSSSSSSSSSHSISHYFIPPQKSKSKS
jgi:hypothetical protein